MPRAAPPRRQLAVGEPLAEEREVESRAASPRRGADRLRVAVAQRLRPAPPVRAGFARGDRLEDGEAPQRVAAGADECQMSTNMRLVRPRRAGARESGDERLERGALDRPDGRVVDEPGRGGGGDRGSSAAERRIEGFVARQSGVENVDVDRIEEAPVGGMIGARPLAVVREELCIGLTPK